MYQGMLYVVGVNVDRAMAVERYDLKAMRPTAPVLETYRYIHISLSLYIYIYVLCVYIYIYTYVHSCVFVSSDILTCGLLK